MSDRFGRLYLRAMEAARRDAARFGVPWIVFFHSGCWNFERHDAARHTQGRIVHPDGHEEVIPPCPSSSSASAGPT